MAVIAADYGVFKSGGESSFAVMELCKAATTKDRVSRKLGKLARKVQMLAEADAASLQRPGTLNLGKGTMPLRADQWHTELRPTIPEHVNGHDLNREVSYGQGIPPYHPER